MKLIYSLLLQIVMAQEYLKKKVKLTTNPDIPSGLYFKYYRKHFPNKFIECLGEQMYVFIHI